MPRRSGLGSALLPSYSVRRVVDDSTRHERPTTCIGGSLRMTAPSSFVKFSGAQRILAEAYASEGSAAGHEKVLPLGCVCSVCGFHSQQAHRTPALSLMTAEVAA
ncbi:hypothetical protein ABL78_3792 [Leptomonas seymouri]|uniref:Uncharacterized protein n=1 Tax=Leptomonas seymouri TaxID=5684 RepID=A0A0N0P627_LEPSE|nr:hypothetical protein ABL78_3792 [Leptomonas seymouri]|eukprot:KPI87139.1 hypothetical protein ABL78_3792 [Leptomonas seymouri]